jgi:hypothetical protein
MPYLKTFGQVRVANPLAGNLSLCGALATCPGDVPWPCVPAATQTSQKYDSRGIAATKPFFRGDETILKRGAFNKSIVTAGILA